MKRVLYTTATVPAFCVVVKARKERAQLKPVSAKRIAA